MSHGIVCLSIDDRIIQDVLFFRLEFIPEEKLFPVLLVILLLIPASLIRVSDMNLLLAQILISRHFVFVSVLRSAINITNDR